MKLRSQAFFLLWAALMCSVPLTAQQKVSPESTSTAVQSLKAPSNNTSASVQAVSSESERYDEFTHRVRLLEEKASQQDRKWYTEMLAPLLTAGIGALAILLSAKLGLSGQETAARATAETARISAEANAEIAKNSAAEAARLAKDEALFKHAEQMMEFKLKQIQEFYGPLHAALQQSRALNDKLMDQLVYDYPDRYRNTAQGSGTDYRWQVIDKNGEWKDFRLVDQLPGIKGNERAMALVDAILGIGKNMCQIISTRAGYAAEDSVEMLGKYMAHHAILTSIRNGPEIEPFEAGRHRIGAFPYGLDQVIGKRYHELSGAIDQYGQAYDRALRLLAEKTS